MILHHSRMAETLSQAATYRRLPLTDEKETSVSGVSVEGAASSREYVLVENLSSGKVRVSNASGLGPAMAQQVPFQP